MELDTLNFRLRTKDGQLISMTADNISVVGLEMEQTVSVADFEEAEVIYFQADKGGTTWTWPYYPSTPAGKEEPV